MHSFTCINIQNPYLPIGVYFFCLHLAIQTAFSCMCHCAHEFPQGVELEEELLAPRNAQYWNY